MLVVVNVHLHGVRASPATVGLVSVPTLLVHTQTNSAAPSSYIYFSVVIGPAGLLTTPARIGF